MVSLLWYLFLAIISTGLIWIGSRHLEGAADQLSAYYGLPAIVQGAIVAAVGSSMPELLTAIIAPLLHGEFELGVAVIIGSAIFNILIIPAAATLSTAGSLEAGRDLVYKEAQFYMLAIAVFLLMCSLAVIYHPVGNGGSIEGIVTVELALIPIAMYGLYVFIQYEETIEYEPPIAPERIAVGRQWGRLLGSFLLIAIGVEGLVRMAIGFGDAFATPSFFWGLTVIAAATSLPDTFVSIVAARRDNDVTSIANVFGSNVFDLLVAVPAGVLVAGAAAVNFSRVVPLIAALIVATLFLFTLMRTDFRLDRWEAYGLVALYGGFLAWIILEATGWITLLG